MPKEATTQAGLSGAAIAALVAEGNNQLAHATADYALSQLAHRPEESESCEAVILACAEVVGTADLAWRQRQDAKTVPLAFSARALRWLNQQRASIAEYVAELDAGGGDSDDPDHAAKEVFLLRTIEQAIELATAA